MQILVCGTCDPGSAGVRIQMGSGSRGLGWSALDLGLGWRLRTI